MTRKEILKQIREMGLIASVRDGEFRILPYLGAPEERAYYTTDEEDALLTAKAIYQEQLTTH